MKEFQGISVHMEKSRRKSISIRIDRDGTILVKAPYFCREAEIGAVLESKKDWILKTREKVIEQKQLADAAGHLSAEEIRALADQALQVIPDKVRYYAEKIGVTYGRITIRCQKTRWGSCSREGNLNFNCLLMLAPEEVQDAIVVHELCHRKEMNHSDRFYAEVLRVCPDYHKWNRWLKEHGGELLGRVL